MAVLTSGELAIVRAASRASSGVGGAGDAHGHELGRAFAAAHDLARQAAAPRARSGVEEPRVVVARHRDAADAPDASSEDAVVGRALAVDRDGVERVVDHARRARRPQHGRLDARVGREERQHRRHAGLDHAGALGHAADRDRARRRSDAAAHALGNGSVVMMARVAASLPVGAERARRRRRCPRRTRSIGSVDADDAGRRDEHVRRRRTRAARAAASAISRASRRPAVAGARVGAAAVDDDRARAAARRCRCCARDETGAACARFVVNTAAAAAGASRDDRAGRGRRLDAAGTPAALNAVQRRRPPLAADAVAGAVHAAGRSARRHRARRRWRTATRADRCAAPPASGSAGRLRAAATIAYWPQRRKQRAARAVGARSSRAATACGTIEKPMAHEEARRRA